MRWFTSILADAKVTCMVLSRLSSLFRKRQISLTWDSVSDGQIQSKVWLLDELSKHRHSLNLQAGDSVWHLAGWNGVLGFLLLGHPDFRDLNYRTLDLDKRALREGHHLNSSWSHQGRFWSGRYDVEKPGWLKLLKQDEKPFVINTSIEHFKSSLWWEVLPKGSRCLLQATDLPHPEHCNPIESLDHFRARFANLRVISATEKVFNYEHLQFRRFMITGIKE